MICDVGSCGKYPEMLFPEHWTCCCATLQPQDGWHQQWQCASPSVSEVWTLQPLIVWRASSGAVIEPRQPCCRQFGLWYAHRLKNLGGKKNACVSAYWICGVTKSEENQKITEYTIQKNGVIGSFCVSVAFTHHLTKSQPKSRPTIDERKTLKNVVLVSTIKDDKYYYCVLL